MRSQERGDKADVEPQKSPVATATDQRLPSPVFRSPINALPHGNLFDDTVVENMQFSQAYTNETVVNINEETITGGTSLAADNARDPESLTNAKY